jgi:hypothetical protein
MTNDKKRDDSKIVPSDKPSIKEVRHDSDEGLKKSTDRGEPTPTDNSVTHPKKQLDS